MLIFKLDLLQCLQILPWRQYAWASCGSLVGSNTELSYFDGGAICDCYHAPTQKTKTCFKVEYGSPGKPKAMPLHCLCVRRNIWGIFSMPYLCFFQNKHTNLGAFFSYGQWCTCAALPKLHCHTILVSRKYACEWQDSVVHTDGRRVSSKLQFMSLFCRWSIPEIKDCLEEAGFKSIHVWVREMPDTKSSGNAKEYTADRDVKYEELQRFNQADAWNAYIVGVANI